MGGPEVTNLGVAVARCVVGLAGARRAHGLPGLTVQPGCRVSKKRADTWI